MADLQGTFVLIVRFHLLGPENGWFIRLINLYDTMRSICDTDIIYAYVRIRYAIKSIGYQLSILYGTVTAN